MADELTPDGAQALQDAARARGDWIMWFVSVAHPDHPGRVVAWALTADPQGGTRLPGLLIADTLDELRAMLPARLTRRDRTAVMSRMVTETRERLALAPPRQQPDFFREVDCIVDLEAILPRIYLIML